MDTVSPAIKIRRIVRKLNEGDITPADARQLAETTARDSGDLAIAIPVYKAATAVEQRDRTTVDR